jgi:toxin YoeB
MAVVSISQGLRRKAKGILTILAMVPFRRPPPFEKLRGDLRSAYSRRINIQHRLVHQVIEDERVVKVIRMWTHYEWTLEGNLIQSFLLSRLPVESANATTGYGRIGEC